MSAIRGHGYPLFESHQTETRRLQIKWLHFTWEVLILGSTLYLWRGGKKKGNSDGPLSFTQVKDRQIRSSWGFKDSGTMNRHCLVHLILLHVTVSTGFCLCCRT